MHARWSFHEPPSGVFFVPPSPESPSLSRDPFGSRPPHYSNRASQGSFSSHPEGYISGSGINPNHRAASSCYTTFDSRTFGSRRKQIYFVNESANGLFLIPGISNDAPETGVLTAFSPKCKHKKRPSTARTTHASLDADQRRRRPNLLVSKVDETYQRQQNSGKNHETTYEEQEMTYNSNPDVSQAGREYGSLMLQPAGVDECYSTLPTSYHPSTVAGDYHEAMGAYYSTHCAEACRHHAAAQSFHEGWPRLPSDHHRHCAATKPHIHDPYSTVNNADGVSFQRGSGGSRSSADRESEIKISKNHCMITNGVGSPEATLPRSSGQQSQSNAGSEKKLTTKHCRCKHGKLIAVSSSAGSKDRRTRDTVAEEVTVDSNRKRMCLDPNDDPERFTYGELVTGALRPNCNSNTVTADEVAIERSRTRLRVDTNEEPERLAASDVTVDAGQRSKKVKGRRVKNAWNELMEVHIPPAVTEGRNDNATMLQSAAVTRQHDERHSRSSTEPATGVPHSTSFTEPFDTTFLNLKTRPGHLAVFIHYLVSNCDPSSLLFYLVTDYYQQQQSSSAKDLRKWAYEIQSSFLLPQSPMKLNAVRSEVVDEIDNILLDGSCDDEALKRIFARSRPIALEEIERNLGDFRNKRRLGLGNVFGENLLADVPLGDRSKEMRVVENLIMQHFVTCHSAAAEFEGLAPATQVLLSSLHTVLRAIGVRMTSSLHDKLIEKCPYYVAKEKKFMKLPKVSSKKTLQTRGHHFSLCQVYSFTVCMQCQYVIWGINAQSFNCSDCDMIVHRQCAPHVDEDCYCGPGSVRNNMPGGAKQRRNYPSQIPNPTQRWPGKVSDCSIPQSVIQEEPDENWATEELDQLNQLDNSPHTKEKDWGIKSFSSDSGYGDTDKMAAIASQQNAIGRSQSMRTREDELRQSKRSNDGSNRRTKSDVDATDKSIVLALASTTSADNVNPTATLVSSGASSGNLSIQDEDGVQSGGPAAMFSPGEISGTNELGYGGGNMLDYYARGGVQCDAARVDISAVDSDLEIENEMPHLEKWIGREKLAELEHREKKRLYDIHELFHTERTHVRNLKILCRVFYNPMLVQRILPPNIIKLLFANIEEILDIHMKMCANIKKQFATAGPDVEIGDFLLEHFDDAAGARFAHAAGIYCQHQQYALEFLKRKSRKDQKLVQFLAEAESLAICRKRQLKDMIPMEMQRLTKYPLLLDTIAKHTNEDSEDRFKLLRCTDCCRAILETVNSAKKTSENVRQLEDLQKRLDTTPYDKVVQKGDYTNIASVDGFDVIDAAEFRSLDLRRFRLIHDGPLQWRISKSKIVDLHVVLLDEMLVFLTRTSESRLTLRFHNVSVPVNPVSRDEFVKYQQCPLLKLNGILPKDVVSDKRTFLLVNTLANGGPQVYEFAANSWSDKKLWIKYLNQHIESFQFPPPGSHYTTSVSTSGEYSGTRVTGEPVGDINGNNRERKLSEPPGSVLANFFYRQRSSPFSDSENNTKPCQRSSPFSDSETPSVNNKLHPESRPGTSLVAPPHLHSRNHSEASSVATLAPPRSPDPSTLLQTMPPLPPLDHLKTNTATVAESLEESQRLLALLHSFPDANLQSLAEAAAADLAPDRAPRELALSAVVHTYKLLEAINETHSDAVSRCSEDGNVQGVEQPPTVSSTRLTYIAAPLMKCLTQLLQSVQKQEDDISQLREELAAMKTAEGGAFAAERAEEYIAAAAEKARRTSSAYPLPTSPSGRSSLSIDPRRFSLKSTHPSVTITSSTHKDGAAAKQRPLASPLSPPSSSAAGPDTCGEPPPRKDPSDPTQALTSSGQSKNEVTNPTYQQSLLTGQHHHHPSSSKSGYGSKTRPVKPDGSKLSPLAAVPYKAPGPAGPPAHRSTSDTTHQHPATYSHSHSQPDPRPAVGTNTLVTASTRSNPGERNTRVASADHHHQHQHQDGHQATPPINHLATKAHWVKLVDDNKRKKSATADGSETAGATTARDNDSISPTSTASPSSVSQGALAVKSTNKDSKPYATDPASAQLEPKSPTGRATVDQLATSSARFSADSRRSRGSSRSPSVSPSRRSNQPPSTLLTTASNSNNYSGRPRPSVSPQSRGTAALGATSPGATRIPQPVPLGSSPVTSRSPIPGADPDSGGGILPLTPIPRVEPKKSLASSENHDPAEKVHSKQNSQIKTNNTSDNNNNNNNKNGHSDKLSNGDGGSATEQVSSSSSSSSISTSTAGGVNRKGVERRRAKRIRNTALAGPEDPRTGSINSPNGNEE